MTIDSQGTILTIDGVVVGGTRSLTGLGSGSPSERDRTTWTNTTFRSFGIGLRDGGSVTVGMLEDSNDNGQRKAYRAWKVGTRSQFVLTAPNGLTQSWYGYVMTFSQDVPADADWTAEMQIRVDGAISGFPDPT